MNESEWQTKKTRIDTKLRSLLPEWESISWREGLDVSQLSNHDACEFPTANGPADLCLVRQRTVTRLAAKIVEWDSQKGFGFVQARDEFFIRLEQVREPATDQRKNC